MEHTIIEKFSRRKLKVCFDLYIEKCKLDRAIKYEVTKSDKVKSIVAYRAKKRMFKALKVFAHRHLIAKNYFRKTVRNVDSKCKKINFSIWKS